MEKLIRSIMVGFVLSVTTLIGVGWRAYGKMDEMRSSVKSEVKKEMIDIRNRDMEHLNNRFNTIEILIAGKVVTREQIPVIENNP
jgi:hypothetical protein